MEKLFSRSDSLVALHSEDDGIIKNNTSSIRSLLGENIPIQFTSIALKKLVGEVYAINYGLNEKSEDFKEMFAAEKEYYPLT